MRIYITGGAASGKKTLSRRVEAQTGIPAFDLNRVGEIEAELPLALAPARLAEIERIVALPDWAAAGSHGSEYNSFAVTADHVVLLETAWRVAAWRIVSRHVRAELAGNN